MPRDSCDGILFFRGDEWLFGGCFGRFWLVSARNGVFGVRELPWKSPGDKRGYEMGVAVFRKRACNGRLLHVYGSNLAGLAFWLAGIGSVPAGEFTLGERVVLES